MCKYTGRGLVHLRVLPQRVAVAAGRSRGHHRAIVASYRPHGLCSAALASRPRAPPLLRNTARAPCPPGCLHAPPASRMGHCPPHRAAASNGLRQPRAAAGTVVSPLAGPASAPLTLPRRHGGPSSLRLASLLLPRVTAAVASDPARTALRRPLLRVACLLRGVARPERTLQHRLSDRFDPSLRDRVGGAVRDRHCSARASHPLRAAVRLRHGGRAGSGV